jgi:hypothetical protein
MVDEYMVDEIAKPLVRHLMGDREVPPPRLSPAVAMAGSIMMVKWFPR